VPESLRLNRLVGVGLNEAELKANSKLTDIKVQDLNAVTQLAMPDESFDAVLIPNSIEFLLNPRAVLREAWRVLRPEGRCIVAFTSKDAYREYRKTQIKMWKDMNDAQHMWIVGSFFRFSADDSWEDLKGYELTPEGAKAGMSGGPGWEAYVVQAAKVSPIAMFLTVISRAI
jgi:ubiquinone/menaquinone biosynthesis C-methylase UbiE